MVMLHDTPRVLNEDDQTDHYHRDGAFAVHRHKKVLVIPPSATLGKVGISD